MNKVIVTIEKGKCIYSAYVSEGLKDHPINGQGPTEIEAINDFHVAIDEIRETYTDDSEEISEELKDLSFEYK